MDSPVVPEAAPKMVVNTPLESTPHPTRFWLNAAAPLNALNMLLTLATFHEPMLASKTDAPLKMLAMVETDTTFHLLMSALNVVLLLNSEAMLVTATVFHSTMLPYVVASPPIHAVTAAATLPFVMQAAHMTEPTVHTRLNVGQAVWKVEPHAL